MVGVSPGARLLSSAVAARRLAARVVVLALALAATTACDPREYARRHGAKLRLSVVTGGTGGVYYPYGGAVAKVISGHVAHVEATAEVTGGSVDNLKLIGRGQADLAFTLADTLDEAVKGQGAFRTFGRVPARTLARLYTNSTHVAALANSGLQRIADLRGRSVSTGAPGSGTETIAFRLLEAAGLDPRRDVRAQGLGVGPSVEALRDGKIDAFFWSGGVPTASVLDIASSAPAPLRLLPSDDLLPALQQRYGPSLYSVERIPRSAYPGLEADVPVIAVANLLVVDEKMSDDLAYEITRALFTRRDELVAVHAEARHLDPATAMSGSPAPYHPGAIRFYREAGLWAQ